MVVGPVVNEPASLIAATTPSDTVEYLSRLETPPDNHTSDVFLLLSFAVHFLPTFLPSFFYDLFTNERVKDKWNKVTLAGRKWSSSCCNGTRLDIFLIIFFLRVTFFCIIYLRFVAQNSEWRILKCKSNAAYRKCWNGVKFCWLYRVASERLNDTKQVFLSIFYYFIWKYN